MCVFRCSFRTCLLPKSDKFSFSGENHGLYRVDQVSFMFFLISAGKEKIKAPNVKQKQPDFKVAYITLVIRLTVDIPDILDTVGIAVVL